MTPNVRTVVRRAIDSGKARVEELLSNHFAKQIGLVPISQTSADDVFVCGYPKSGNTWFQHMLAGLVFGADTEAATDVLMNDLIPDVHFAKYYRRYGAVSFFKTHHLPRPEYRRIIYLLRDGRDAMVSYFHYLNALNGGANFQEIVQSGHGETGKWQDHVIAYQANPHGAQKIMVRYEDLRRDTATQLRRVVEFLGLERSEGDLSRVVQATSFERMRAKEQKTGWAGPWPRDRFFVRRGVVGSFKDEMPPEVLATFIEEARETLLSSGYSV
jgi:hypothetical protein